MRETLEALRQALGGELPEPNTPAFEQALRRIQRERPDLLDALKSLQDPQAIPPTNDIHKANLKDFATAAKRAKAIHRTQGWLNRWFGIKDPRTAKTHFNYRLVAIVFGTIIFLGGLVWAFWPELSKVFAGRPASGASIATQANPANPPVDPVINPVPVAPPAPNNPMASLPDPSTTTTRATTGQSSEAASAVPPPPANSTAAASTTTSTGAVPPPPLPEYSATPVPPAGPLGSNAAVASPFNPVKVERVERSAPANTVAVKGEANTTERKYVALGKESVPGNTGESSYLASLTPSSNKHTVLDGNAREKTSPVALTAQAAAQGNPTALRQETPTSQYVALAPVDKRQAAPSASEPGSDPAPAPASTSTPNIALPAPGNTTAATPSAPTPATNPTGPTDPFVPPMGNGPLSAPAPSTPNLALAEYPFDIGEKQEGELVSGVVIPEGSSQAALMVRTKEGYVFFGAATLDKAGRLQIQFDRAYKGRTAYLVRAVGLDQRGIAGIPANVSEQTPSLLTNLLRGAASGLVSYIDFYAKSSSTTILPGGGVASSNTPPPLGLTILSGSAKQIAAPPDSTSVVRVWSLDPGTKMQVLIVPGDAGGNR